MLTQTNYVSALFCVLIISGFVDRAAANPAPTNAYDELLHAHVDADGFVDYDAIVAEPNALNRYVEYLALPDALPPVEQPNARLVALINAYNAFTIKLIVNHYDDNEAPQSITDLHGGKPWDQEIWNLGGQTVSLNQIEHEMIRKEFPDEPRIHWAVVCAAYSCPPLRNEAYTTERLGEQLADQERRVLLAGDERFIRIDPRTGIVTVRGITKLFEWYGQDFGDDWKVYVRKATGHGVLSPGFIDYDWKLNAQVNRPD